MNLSFPTFADVLRARQQIASFLRPTPLYPYPSLSQLVGCQIWVKLENHLPTCAFKVRGGVNLASQLSEDERRRGIISASTGNHGQSVAYGAHLFGIKARICVPEGANPTKIESMQTLGAEIIFHGRDFDEAREHCEKLAAENRYRYVHSGNEPLLIAGVATATLEILEAQPDIDVILIPLGGGSGAAGACIVAKTINPKIQVIAVQSEAAPAAYRSWKEHRLVEDEMNTWAEGLQTRTAFELPQQILWDKLDDFVLVSDDEIRAATRLMIEKTRNLVEGAGAAALAAALTLKDRLAGRKVVLVCSGGNLSLKQLRELLHFAAGHE
jgi:threonine dehydratase